MLMMMSAFIVYNREKFCLVFAKLRTRLGDQKHFTVHRTRARLSLPSTEFQNLVTLKITHYHPENQLNALPWNTKNIRQ